ncbi:MAG: nucleotide exchange factor GrpE [Hyphomicrobium sp.]
MTDPEKTSEDGQIQQPANGPTVGADLGAAPLEPAALAARVAELESQQNDLTDRLLRAHADMDNLRKRTEREKVDAAKYAITKFANDIVGISDNFQRAVASVPPGASDEEGPLKSVVDGVVMTERAFLQVLERHGVRRLDPQGQPFNPNLHQAVMEQDDAEVPAGTVLRVFQLGYMIEERVLRPAMVVVSRGGGAKPAKPTEAAPMPGSGPESDDGAAT